MQAIVCQRTVWGCEPQSVKVLASGMNGTMALRYCQSLSEEVPGVFCVVLNHLLAVLTYKPFDQNFV